MSFMMRWVGQGGYELRLGGKTVLLDPYYSDLVEHSGEALKRLVPPPMQLENVRADYLLSTHDHMDHMDEDLIAAMDCTGIRFVCPALSAKKLLALGKGIIPEQIDVIAPDGVFQCDAFKLEAVFADHTADSVGFVIESDGLRVYFTGDTLLHERVGKDVRADVICCCVNGKLGNMNAEEAITVVKRSGARLAIPNHYGMFAENTVDPQTFVRLAQKEGIFTHVAQLYAWFDLATI
ncbi:MAG: MBL fold metallo-hydrolase [Oscillospiraceae bacterium]|jgi:L-ascorbate metabolism protein UlaG (beta-lactamase superfamily)|nr:MBL fold metallo-hydrolase [Oscillospiraceae bacterium]